MKGGNSRMKTVNRGMDEVRSIQGFPYFVLRNEITNGYNNYITELHKIKKSYIQYKNGSSFTKTRTLGDYVASDLKYKKAKTLIDKEARFMFSQTPDIMIQARSIGQQEVDKAKQYQNLIDSILNSTNFPGNLLKATKDCLIGRRVACLIDFSEVNGIGINFYNALQFYYETEPNLNRITKFISFEEVTQSKSSSDRRILVNRYEETEPEVIMFYSILYDGSGNVMEELIPEKQIELKKIPVVIILNDGLLSDIGGISDIDEIIDYEASYSSLANSDIDSDKQGMNPIRYVIDMNSKTTQNLSVAAGSFWELKSEQNQNNVSPSIGTLAPQLNHTESVKVSLDRIENAMYSQLDVPNISEESLSGVITSGKTIEALYHPLMVRCDEKLKTWLPAIRKIIEFCIEISMLNSKLVSEIYEMPEPTEMKYDIVIVENYALLKDETEEKNSDVTEINANVRSRKSYLKKWRSEEFKTDEQIDEELMQIAYELNLFDTLSANTQVQGMINDRGIQQALESDLEGVENGEV